MRKVLKHSVVAATLLVVLAANPAGATVSASYGAAVANTPTFFSKPTNSCVNNCMVGSAAFTPSGTIITGVQMFVYLYRFKSATQSGPVCTAGSSCSDTQLVQSSTLFSTNATNRNPTTLSVSTSCASVQSATTGYYIRVAFSNGNGVSYAESSPVLKVKGC